MRRYEDDLRYEDDMRVEDYGRELEISAIRKYLASRGIRIPNHITEYTDLVKFYNNWKKEC